MSHYVQLGQRVGATGEQDLDAGDFLAWLAHTRRMLIVGGTADVACGACNACCRSSYFVHVRADEAEVLARIPRALLFPAPGKPAGHKLLGFNNKGECPMLIDNKCSIYAHRPQTCRDFDCRVFAACDIKPMGDDVGAQAGRWRFSDVNEQSYEQAALRAAAMFLRERSDCFPGGAPTHPAQIAIVALKVYQVFIGYHEEYKRTGKVPTDSDIAHAIMHANSEFNAQMDASLE